MTASVIGSAWGSSASLGAKTGRALLHALSRATIARSQGGKFSAGFWSGFASSALAPLAGSSTTMAAIVGGTASELGGGKFANGAVTAAFVHMYNDMGHGANRTYKKRSLGISKGFKDLYDGIISIPTALVNYGDYLARVVGFRDWQNENILPWYKWEAKAEYKVLMYALENHKLDIASGLWQDMLNRPNYYIGGFAAGAGLGYMNSAAGGLYTAGSFSVKPAAAATDYIHTKINPFH